MEGGITIWGLLCYILKESVYKTSSKTPEGSGTYYITVIPVMCFISLLLHVELT